MSYLSMKQELLRVFRQNNFEGVWQDGEEQKLANRGRNPNINILHYKVPNNYNLNLTINFPGMKTTRNRYGFVYDYRVDMNNIAISHANIILDLYNKAEQMHEDTNLLIDFLIDLAINGNEYTRLNHQRLLNYKFAIPHEATINYVNNTHTRLNKVFPRAGNEGWSYSIDQLAHLIMWIVLQEDINYPMPRLQGRRMPFYRYLEAIYCAQNPDDKYHTLGSVIERALSHSQPQLWTECRINYTPIRNLM